MPDSDLPPRSSDPPASPARRLLTGGRPKHGTFVGVFIPTLLAIVSVILFLREGWVLGNVGLLGSGLIIALTFLITALTGLSISTIATNLGTGTGGAYAIISRSLGLEVGGSIGVPLYLSHVLVAALYIFGFREGWLWLFPEHPALLVDLVAFLALFGIAYRGAGLAFHIQYLAMAALVAALLSIGMAAAQGSMREPLTEIVLRGTYAGAPGGGFPGTSFWPVFAIFFPAAAGLMAGISMSDDLENPRRSVPRGTLSAIGVSLVLYLAVAWWLARSATSEQLVGNYTIMIDRAFWGPAVLAGLLGATFSSAFTTIVGAPRILLALADRGVMPAGEWLSRRTSVGEPRHAILMTGGLVAAVLLLRDLNTLAFLLTLFFLVTCAMINLVVFTEQMLGSLSFRPLFRIPPAIPFLGTASCLLAMFIVHAVFSLLAVAAIMLFYGFLLRRRLEMPLDEARSGLFVSLAEWAAKKVSDLPVRQDRAWKPSLLIPVDDSRELRGTFLIIRSLGHPKGSVNLMGLAHGGERASLSDDLSSLAQAFRERGVHSSWTVIDSGGFAEGMIAGMQALRGAFFRPNIVFLTLPRTLEREEDCRKIIREAERQELGTLLYAAHPRAALGQRRTINIWVRDRSPNWEISTDIGNLDLPLLVACQLKRNWSARMRLITVVRDGSQKERAEGFLGGLVDTGRIPDTTVIAATGSFDAYVEQAPQADLNIFGLLASPDFEFANRMVRKTHATCMLARDSGHESALA